MHLFKTDFTDAEPHFMEKSTGTIIRLTKLTETSLIVTWCTEEHGLIKTVAKGARRPKSPYAGKLDIFFKAQIDWVSAKKGELHTLKEVAVENYREGLRKDYSKLQMASYFSYLMESVVESQTKIVEFTSLLERAIDYLDVESANKIALLHYEKQLVKLLGMGGKNSAAHLLLEEISGKRFVDRALILRNISDLH